MWVVVGAACGVWDGDFAHGFDGGLARLPAVEPAVETERLRYLLADGVDGVERGHRVLEDHRDVVAANLPHALFGRGQKVLAREQNLAPDDAARRAYQTHHRERRDGLPAARLADEPQHLALL